jgi:hypothetical protein
MCSLIFTSRVSFGYLTGLRPFDQERHGGGLSRLDTGTQQSQDSGTPGDGSAGPTGSSRPQSSQKAMQAFRFVFLKFRAM